MAVRGAGGAMAKAEMAMAGLQTAKPKQLTDAERNEKLTAKYEQQLARLNELLPEATEAAKASNSMFSFNDGSAVKKYNALRKQAKATRDDLSTLRSSLSMDGMVAELPPMLADARDNFLTKTPPTQPYTYDQRDSTGQIGFASAGGASDTSTSIGASAVLLGSSNVTAGVAGVAAT